MCVRFGIRKICTEMEAQRNPETTCILNVPKAKGNSNTIVCNESLSHFFSVIQQIEKEVPSCSKKVKQSLTILRQLISHVSFLRTFEEQ